MKAPTETQARILNFIRAAQEDGGAVPTYREISKAFDFASPKAAFDHVIALEKKGLLNRRRGKARGIGLVSNTRVHNMETVAVPILGNIAAGLPTDQSEVSCGVVHVDRTLLGASWGKRHFAVRVRGDSMTGRGIFDGDFAIAETVATARTGDVVVALIENESTLKTLVKSSGRPVLKAENPNYPDLVPATELVIQGVVRALIRRVQ